MNALPKGYEAYENFENSQVYCRKAKPKLITELEVARVEKTLQNLSGVSMYKVDVKKDEIIIYLPRQNLEDLDDTFGRMGLNFKQNRDDFFSKVVDYSPEFKFLLVDKEKRIFQASRYCYLGRVDDWIGLGSPDILEKLLEFYLPHFGKDSYFELY